MIDEPADAREDKPEKPPARRYTLAEMIDGVAKQANRAEGSFAAFGDVHAKQDSEVLDQVMTLLQIIQAREASFREWAR